MYISRVTTIKILGVDICSRIGKDFDVNDVDQLLAFRPISVCRLRIFYRLLSAPYISQRRRFATLLTFGSHHPVDSNRKSKTDVKRR